MQRILAGLFGGVFGRLGRPPMASPNDQEFAAVIGAIAKFRTNDRSMAADVTSFFQPMSKRLSMTELAEYLIGRFPSQREERRASKHYLVDIRERELKSYSRAFAQFDRISITVRYSDDWRVANRFLAVLVNDLA